MTTERTAAQGPRAVVAGAANGIWPACAKALPGHDVEPLALDLDPSAARVVDGGRS